jgi:hypothetical protein
MAVLVAEFVSWKIIANAKVLIFLKKTNDGNFWYSEMGMVLWFREAFDKL